jgi:hypothetical protein
VELEIGEKGGRRISRFAQLYGRVRGGHGEWVAEKPESLVSSHKLPFQFMDMHLHDKSCSGGLPTYFRPDRALEAFWEASIVLVPILFPLDIAEH